MKIKRWSLRFLSVLICLGGFYLIVCAQAAKPAAPASRLPTLFIIGDSTVKNSTKGLLGWGDPLANFFDQSKINILNRARGGRSSRTFYTEGLWDQILSELQPGDFVLMQFGHNDGGAINDASRARGSLKGTGTETEEIDNLMTKKREVVRTFGWYMRKYVADAKAKGAIPIVLSQIPRNIWQEGKVERVSSNYGKWAADVAKAEGAFFIDLNELVARRYEPLGPDKVKELYFLEDHTHTTPAGAQVNAAAVVEGLRALSDCPLKAFLLDQAVAPLSGQLQTLPVSMRVDASRVRGPFRFIGRMFGADEPNFAYMKNGQTLLAELGDLGPNIYFRTHNLLTTGDGTPALKWGSTNVYREDSKGKPVYDWRILDRIFDAYRQHGVRPYVQIGFMPQALSTRPEPYQHRWTPTAKYDEIFTGWAYPPKDYQKWGELVYQWARHCVRRYGRAEVERWYWEVWNEPNIGYWRGTPEEFQKLHDYAIDAVRRALPTAKVGGPDVAGSGGKFMRDFLEHCLRGTNYATARKGTPLDFISFHAKGSPKFVDGHVQMGIANQLRAIDAGFEIVACYPELKDKPIVIGESDPDGCAACQGPQLGYRNSTMYSSYTAASMAREYELAERRGVNLDSALTWAFEFENQSYFAGFRVLASNGIDLPVLNVFRMFSRMSGRRLGVESNYALPLDAILKDGVRAQPEVSALASIDGKTLSVLIWHYHDDDVSGPTAQVELQLKDLPIKAGQAKLVQYRIDNDHSNAFTAWRQMGSPPEPTSEQYAKLRTAGQLATIGGPEALEVRDGQLVIRLDLPRQAVSLLVLKW